MKTFTVQLTEEDINNICIGVNLRVNLIQTGDPMVDMEQAEREKWPAKNMSVDQMKLVISSKDLITKLQNIRFNSNNLLR